MMDAMDRIESTRKAMRAILAVAGGLMLLFLVVIFLLAGPRPGRIRAQYKEIQRLQENLISAEITSRRMNHVQSLIRKNLALSATDTLAQGASLSFLNDLAKVLDRLKINLVSLEPLMPVDLGGSVETPYRMEIVCNYHQLCQLVNKMEKSPRFISIRDLKVENYFDDYFAEDRNSADQCNVSLEVHTLTLLKGAPR